MKAIHHSIKRRQGSAIPVVVILLIGTSMILGSVLRFAVSETRLNKNHELWIEAKFVAEAISEYGFAELRRRFDKNSSFPEDGLLPKTGSNPLILPGHFYEFYKDSGSKITSSNVILPPNPYDPYEDWGTYDTEIIAGIIPKGEWVFIDPNIPGNETDKLKGRRVFARGIAVYGKATVEVPHTGQRLTAYCRQELQVRDAPLFSHAIFYNMDMEIAPGPAMDITGPVHVNGDAYIQANSSLDFYGQVTIAGDLHHGRHPESGQSDSYGSVKFLNGSSPASLTNMKEGSVWLESSVSNFKEIAAERWRGNLMTTAHHVENKPLVDIPDYLEDDPGTTAADDPLNHGYKVVEKAKGTYDSNFSLETERQKYAYKAGLTMRVNTASGHYELVTYKRDTNGDIIYDAGTGKPVEVVLDDSADPIADVELFSSATSAGEEVVSSGLRDKRRGKAVDLVELDVGKLRNLVHNNDETEWGGASEHKPENWWNGVVYVEFPDGASVTRNDNVQPGVDGWGLKLKNAQQIPNPSFAHSESIYGTSFATNNVLYLEGHFNADGSQSTGSATEPDSASVIDEPPAAIAADAINILSANWDDAESGKDLNDRQAYFTEISAALLTGLVPSGKNGSSTYSGGVENFPRFLEKWNGQFRLRGSIVSLFESEIATEPWGSSGVYRAPNRDWGFNSNFAQGYYPPGTPNTRTYRRIDFRDLAETEYTAEIATLKTYLSP